MTIGDRVRFHPILGREHDGRVHRITHIRYHAGRVLFVRLEQIGDVWLNADSVRRLDDGRHG